MSVLAWTLNPTLLHHKPVPEGEAAWILQAKQGDSAAFGRLIQAYQGPLLRYLCRMVRHEDVGQDLCQETFLKAWKGLGDFQMDKPLSPWLYKIATNLALNFLQRRSWRFLSLRVFLKDDPEGQEIDLQANLETAEDLLLREADIGFVQEALGKLEPQHRSVLLLFYGEDLSCKELADALEIQESAAKVRLFRARAQLKKILEQRQKP